MFDTGERILGRAQELAAYSEDGARLTRVFLSPQQRQASAQVVTWMVEAGMTARVDAIGNVIGRYEGSQPDMPALESLTAQNIVRMSQVL
jgi:allantoate deiminase